jgi:hypothetical protein
MRGVPLTNIVPSQPRAESIGWPNSALCIAASIFVLEILLFARTLVGFPGPHRYYALQWTVHYDNGFCRRGLPGAVLRLLHLDNGNYVLIAFFGWAITLALYGLVVRAVLRLVAPLPPHTRAVLLVILLLTPATTGILVQATADPLQLILLALVTLFATLVHPGRNLALVSCAFAAFGAVSILVHEASLFFVGPALLVTALVRRKSPVDGAALAGYILGALPALLLMLHFSERNGPAAITPLQYRSVIIPATSEFRVEKFSALLARENADHFHSGVRGYVLMLRNAIGTLVLPLFLGLVVSHTTSRALGGRFQSRRRNMLVFAFPLLLCSPLWIIGHDWGRYASYVFTLSLVVLSSDVPSPAAAANQESVELPAFAIGALLVLSGVTTSHILTNYLLKGLGDDTNTLVASLLLCAAITYVLFGRSRAGRQLHLEKVS